MSWPFTVAIPTRDRSALLACTLDALETQQAGVPQVVVIDQSDLPDAALRERAESGDWLTVVADDEGRGLSRARNVAWRAIESEWIIYLDDDAVPDPDWSQEITLALRSHPEADLVTGHVFDPNAEARGDYLAVSVQPLEHEQVRSGRWTRPWDVGLGICTALRRSVIVSLDGWDERLGAGAPRFGAAEDMDFNYRLLRAGGIGYATPRVRVAHAQWRRPEELVTLYARYMLGWTAFAMKHVKTGDPVGGLWLWALGAQDALRMTASAARRRSRLRGRVARAKIYGLAVGTVEGLRADW